MLTKQLKLTAQIWQYKMKLTHLVLNLRESIIKLTVFIVLVLKFYNKNNEIDYFSAQI